MSEETQAKKKALLVDDDMDFRLQQRMLLESMGLEVIEAETRAQAEKILDETHPDIAVIDLMMEETDSGFVLCHRLKKHNPNLPVIIVTAVASETGMTFSASTREERSWIKADAVLNKPVRPAQLRKEIDRLLRA